MLAKERQNAIVEMVNEKGSVQVKDLSVLFNMTQDSIRKDLTLLEKKGLLKKTYGGAMKVRISAHDYDASQRKEKHVKEKQIIAQKAFNLIHAGDVLFLDISTTNLLLSQLIVESQIQVTIVTNMLDIMMTVKNAPFVKLIFLGGTISDKQDGFVGALTNQQLMNYRFDIAFIGVVGVDVDKNRISCYVVEDGLTKQLAIENSSSSYLMMETRKFHEDGSYWFGKADDISGFIMEKDVDETTSRKLSNLGIICL